MSIKGPQVTDISTVYLIQIVQVNNKENIKAQ